MITTLKLSLVGWLINLVKWKSIANESTAVWHFSIQFKLKSPTIIISQLLREGTLETWPPGAEKLQMPQRVGWEWGDDRVAWDELCLNRSASSASGVGWRCLQTLLISSSLFLGAALLLSPGEVGVSILWSKSPWGLLQQESRVFIQIRGWRKGWMLLFLFQILPNLDN